MKSISKHIRHKMYVAALADYKKWEGRIGLCSAIWMNDTAYRLFNENKILPEHNPFMNDCESFPEIAKHKPEMYMPHMTYWFPLDHTEIRFQILIEAIELTKPTKRMK